MPLRQAEKYVLRPQCYRERNRYLTLFIKIAVFIVNWVKINYINFTEDCVNLPTNWLLDNGYHLVDIHNLL